MYPEPVLLTMLLKVMTDVKIAKLASVAIDVVLEKPQSAEDLTKITFDDLTPEEHAAVKDALLTIIEFRKKVTYEEPKQPLEGIDFGLGVQYTCRFCSKETIFTDRQISGFVAAQEPVCCDHCKVEIDLIGVNFEC